MILTDEHIKAIKAAAESVGYGSVTLNILADKPDRLELNVQNRIRLENEPQQITHRKLLLKKTRHSPK